MCVCVCVCVFVRGGGEAGFACFVKQLLAYIAYIFIIFSDSNRFTYLTLQEILCYILLLCVFLNKIV